MNLFKLEMELFLPLPDIWAKNIFSNSLHILSTNNLIIAKTYNRENAYKWLHYDYCYYCAGRLVVNRCCLSVIPRVLLRHSWAKYPNNQSDLTRLQIIMSGNFIGLPTQTWVAGKYTNIHYWFIIDKIGCFYGYVP